MNGRFVACTFDFPWTVGANLAELAAQQSDRREQISGFISIGEAKTLIADPAAAEDRARNALATKPADPLGLYLLGAALRKQGHDESAKSILESLTESQPQLGPAWRELGLALARLGQRQPATVALLRAIDLNYLDSEAWYALGDQLTFPSFGPDEPRLKDAELRGDPSENSDSILRERVNANPRDADAIKRLADSLLRRDRWNHARPLLERCVEIAPEYAAARFRYATMLFVHGEFAASLPQIEELLKSDPPNTLYRSLKALALTWSEQFGAGIAEFEEFIEDCPREPGLWLQYGRLLWAERRTNAAAAFKRAIAMLPSFIEAYVIYAGAKSLRFDAAMIEQIHAQLARPDLAEEDRAQLHSVLGKAYEDLERYPESFDNYRASNEILLANRKNAAEFSTIAVRRAKAVFTPAFFRARPGVGCPANDPIFIVGMPRSGSTLIEQILSSHSAIEGLGELTDLSAVVARLHGYPHVLQTFDGNRFRELGEEYLALTRPRRKLGKPFFTDKLPVNFVLSGLIHLILPNAKIIDARRHPLDCGFSCYKHYFPGGQLSISLDDIGRCYVDYARLMAHFDEVLPGKVHRVIYERLVQDFDAEVRRLLEYLGLPFEEQCLRFHESGRLTLTPSADQVRRPIYGTAAGHWRHFEAWLDPLKEKLGYLLQLYPEVPTFYDEVHVRMKRPLTLGQSGGRFALVKGLKQRSFENASGSVASG